MRTLVGYADRLSVLAGEEIGFKVSCRSPTYHADIVRLVHGDGAGRDERQVLG